MANGQEKGEQNLTAFKVWAATLSDDDFRQITYRGQLNRGEIAKAVGCGKSALTQNPALRAQLQSLEDDLRHRKVLPPLTEKAKASLEQPKQYDQTTRRRQLDANKIGLLEQENLELKAKVRELEGRLERFGELSSIMANMGLMPR